MRIALIADSHVSPRAPECVENWRAAASAIDRMAPALTVHLGDISLDGEHRSAELDFAAGMLATWPTPIRCLAGNHDMGTGSGERPLSTPRLARYVETLGADHWVLHHGPWHLFGLNAQLLASGTRAEADQWAWLEHEAAALRAGDRAVLCLHRPLVRAPGDAGMPTGRYVAADAARRLLNGPLRPALKLVVSGHTHQALDFEADGVRHIWVPSSGFVFPDALQAPVGTKVTGFGELTLDDNAAHYALHSLSG